jgi:hypothetical protein
VLDRLHQLETQDDFTREMVASGSFICCRLLSDGTYIGICHLLTTFGLCIGVNAIEMYQRRYCYENAGDCIWEYQTLLHGQQVPSGGWVARRPETPEMARAKEQPRFDVTQFWGKV